MSSASQAMRRATSALNGAAQRQCCRADPALEHRQADGYHHLGAFAARGGELTAVQRALRELDQSVGIAPDRSAQVDLGVGGRPRCGQWTQCRANDLRAFPIQASG